MPKEFYRNFFAQVSPFVKLNYFCKRVGVRQPHLSLFIKDKAYDMFMSVENLELLYNAIKSELENVV